MPEIRRTLIHYYAAENKRAPDLAIFGRWPSTSSMTKMLSKKGYFLASRPASAVEQAESDAALRHRAFGWKTSRCLIAHAKDISNGFHIEIQKALNKRAQWIFELDALNDNTDESRKERP